MKKLRLGIVFGGRSAEHEVSLQSAKNVLQAIDKTKYDVILIGIGKDGKWYLSDYSKLLPNRRNLKSTFLNPLNQVSLVSFEKRGQLIDVSNKKSLGRIDVVFPVLHGPYGEDGTIQGMFKLMNVPFVGAGVLGSAIGMDKEITKRLLKEAGLPVARFIVLHRTAKTTFKEIKKDLGVPFFVKPANLGSSVGIYKIKSEKNYEKAVKDAFRYDNKVLVEEYIKGRELECSVLGNEKPVASLPGEIVVGKSHEFYSYKAKYLDENGALLKIPASLTAEETLKVQELAIKAYKTLQCEGMGRVDFFLKNNGQIVVNEINTIPGFTKISMYPKLWEASGISYTKLIEGLIKLAFERFAREQKLETSKA